MKILSISFARFYILLQYFDNFADTVTTLWRAYNDVTSSVNTFWRLYDDFEAIDGLTSMQRSKFWNMSQNYPKVVIKFS